MSNKTKQDAVDFKHPEYEKHESQVQLCNDFYNGIDTARQHLYPRVNENDTDFANRKEKAILSNFVERIVTTQAGQIFSSPIMYEEIPEKTMALLDDMDIGEFAKDTCRRGIRDGKSYILLDLPVNGGDPYFINVNRANLINWRKDEEGKYMLVVIAESYAKDDGFSIVYEPQYRVIRADGNIELWRETATGKESWEVTKIKTSYNFIPLYELHIGDIPPLYDIATVNKNHFNAYSEKDSIISTATQPSLFTKGLGIEDDDDLAIGVNYTINTDNPDASMEWVELEGKSIQYAQEDIKTKEVLMAERALQIQGESLQTKTATQVSQENNESTSRLSDISEDLENTLNRAYNGWHRIKYSKDAVGRILLPNDFVTAGVDANMINSLNTLVVAGNLSRKSLLTTLSDNGMIEIDSVEDEIKEIEKELIDEPIQSTD